MKTFIILMVALVLTGCAGTKATKDNIWQPPAFNLNDFSVSFKGDEYYFSRNQMAIVKTTGGNRNVFMVRLQYFFNPELRRGIMRAYVNGNTVFGWAIHKDYAVIDTNCDGIYENKIGTNKDIKLPECFTKQGNYKSLAKE
jgi:hypothetical protein